MAAFSFQHPSCLLDSVFLPNHPIKMSGLLEEGCLNTSPHSFFPSSSPSQPFQEIPIDVRVHECCDIRTSVTEKQKADSSSMIVDLEGSDLISQKDTPIEKKRKNRDGSCLSSAQSKEPKKTKARKQKKCFVSLKEIEVKKNKADKKNQKKASEDTPTRYVHVRARRGEATDSHSLAERVRRERISKRFKVLQGLVPGCDTVTSKALMLDEIINYVQSLQHQVEFLSMKLASVSPVFYDFRVDLGSFMLRSEKFPSVQQSIPTPTTSFADITTTLAATNNYNLQDSSVSLLLQQGQRPNAVSQDENLLWDLDDQRQRFINQLGYTTLCSFQ